MEELILLGRNDDNTALLVATDEGLEFTLPIDESLKRELAAANAPRPALGNEPPAALTPREIQSRIRRGESISDIAHAENVDADWVSRYAGPVLAERAHMARRASETFVRRNGAEEMLVTLVERQLGQSGIETFDLSWDSWRRDDTRWNVTVCWPSGAGQGVANWIFDAATLAIVALDDSARWIFDELTQAPSKIEEPTRPRLVGIPTREEAEVEEVNDRDVDVPAWAAPSQPTIPVQLNSTDSPSWDDILFGSRPTE